MIAILKAVWALTRTPWGAGVLATLGALAAFAWWTRHAEQKGRAAERAAIERQNEEAKDATFAAIRDTRACLDAGGVWNLRYGRCDKRVQPVGK